MRNIHLVEEHTMLEAILYAKFKDKALTLFQTREKHNNLNENSNTRISERETANRTWVLPDFC